MAESTHQQYQAIPRSLVGWQGRSLHTHSKPALAPPDLVVAAAPEKLHGKVAALEMLQGVEEAREVTERAKGVYVVPDGVKQPVEWQHLKFRVQSEGVHRGHPDRVQHTIMLGDAFQAHLPPALKNRLRPSLTAPRSPASSTTQR